MSTEVHVWAGSLLDELGQDLRYGLRGLKRNPGFTFVVLLSLAVGIGANTAIFALVDATLNRPLPFPEPDRLVVLTEENAAKGLSGQGASPGNVLDWREARDVFSGLAGSYARSVVVSEEDGAEIVTGAQVPESNRGPRFSFLTARTPIPRSSWSCMRRWSPRRS